MHRPKTRLGIGERIGEDRIASEKEKELVKSEPEKHAARRSSLFEAEKLGAFRRMSAISLDCDAATTNESNRFCTSSTALNNKSRRQSFIEPGKFDQERSGNYTRKEEKNRHKCERIEPTPMVR
jgi:hypothetical protein